MVRTHKVSEAVNAVYNAYANFNHKVLFESPTLDDLKEPLQVLERAIARVQVIGLLHPSLTVADDLPAGAIGDTDAADMALLNAALDVATKIPSSPATVILQATPLLDGSPEDEVRQWLNDRMLTAQPDGAEGYVLDLGGLASFIADTFLPRPIDDIPPMNPDNPSRRALREAFGPREENE